MAGCLGSQSVKCTAVPGQRGVDTGKKINGRKRHILVNTLGSLLTVGGICCQRAEPDAARLPLHHSTLQLQKAEEDFGQWYS